MNYAGTVADVARSRQREEALEVNDSAVRSSGDETLEIITKELVETVRKNVTIDWPVMESVQAMLRGLVKQTLWRYGYPLDEREKAVAAVLE